ncbi:anthranilate phosphoribosyltransferase [Candidatus Berkiella aquae]|uniref:Anthranilate phosphoribosyltransferase n=1 Tax=Candidatus Berkiella aquae TaxID=295108 RepID=A0A0Q9YWL2_9GAMM|nr:anthranilate phosphoribosyltransferase [Candidatus Berkiella aquae]MCS5710878.1 anthranilate phosphoribosyltransferase [Candidatus Berkiella aquae]
MYKLDQLCEGTSLSQEEATQLFLDFLNGKLSEIEMTALLVALKAKGESTTEILGALSAMRQSAHPFPCLAELKKHHRILDCVGTGGDNQHSLNISTPTAIMAAQLGLTVAKHGNRAVSSKCGTADLLEAVGMNIAMSPQTAKRSLEENRFTFLFSPLYHPATQMIKKVRNNLKSRTLFNLLGPLLNPTSPEILLIGVYHPSLCERFAKVLQAQGFQKALIVHGEGLDEIALHGTTTGILLDQGQLSRFSLTPEEAGLKRFPLDAIKGGEIHFNQAQFLNLLQGKGTNAYRSAVALNTGVLLYLADKVPTIAQGVEMVLAALESDAGFQLLQKVKEVSHAQ